MKKNLILFLLTVLFATTIIACKQQTPKQVKDSSQTKRDEITANEFQQLIETDSNLVILDVRTPEELTGPLGHINGVINIPVQVIDKRAGELEKYKKDNIYIICRSGHRSGIATKILTKKGFNAINVLGGMINYNRLKK